jgi:AraC-like DNA-binding protein
LAQAWRNVPVQPCAREIAGVKVETVTGLTGSEFRKHYDCTIGEYPRRLRSEFACREIAVSDAPLVEIALSAGFANQAHFTRTFKRLKGITPTEYRSIYRTP